MFTSLWPGPASHLVTHLSGLWSEWPPVPFRPCSWQGSEESKGCGCHTLWALCPVGGHTQAGQVIPQMCTVGSQFAGHSVISSQQSVQAEKLSWGEDAGERGEVEEKGQSTPSFHLFTSFKRKQNPLLGDFTCQAL